MSRASLATGALAAGRSAALVLSLYALCACVVVACSKGSTGGTEVTATSATPAQPSASVATAPSPSAAPSESMTAPSPSSDAAAPVSSATSTCGGEGAAKCPLQGWMEQELKPAMKAKDIDKVSALLAKLATMAPASYDGWAKISKDASAEVAAKKDLAPAKKSCTTCHEKFKKRWKAEDRGRAI